MIIPASAAVAMVGIVVMALVFNYEIVKAAWLPLLFLSVGQLLLVAICPIYAVYCNEET